MIFFGLAVVGGGLPSSRGCGDWLFSAGLFSPLIKMGCVKRIKWDGGDWVMGENSRANFYHICAFLFLPILAMYITRPFCRPKISILLYYRPKIHSCFLQYLTFFVKPGNFNF
jgi:hypothetical protein